MPHPLTDRNVRAWQKLHSLLAQGYPKLLLDCQVQHQVNEIIGKFRVYLPLVDESWLLRLLWDVCYRLPSELAQFRALFLERWSLETSAADARALDESIATETRKLTAAKVKCELLRSEDEWLGSNLADAREFVRVLRSVPFPRFHPDEEIARGCSSVEYFLRRRGEVQQELSMLTRDCGIYERKLAALRENRLYAERKLVRYRHLVHLITHFEESLHDIEQSLDCHFNHGVNSAL